MIYTKHQHSNRNPVLTYQGDGLAGLRHPLGDGQHEHGEGKDHLRKNMAFRIYVTYIAYMPIVSMMFIRIVFFYCFVSASIHFGGQKSKLRDVKGDSRKQKKTACILYVL